MHGCATMLLLSHSLSLRLPELATCLCPIVQEMVSQCKFGNPWFSNGSCILVQCTTASTKCSHFGFYLDRIKIELSLRKYIWLLQTLIDNVHCFMSYCYIEELFNVVSECDWWCEHVYPRHMHMMYSFNVPSLILQCLSILFYFYFTQILFLFINSKFKLLVENENLVNTLDNIACPTLSMITLHGT